MWTVPSEQGSTGSPVKQTQVMMTVRVGLEGGESKPAGELSTGARYVFTHAKKGSRQERDIYC